MGNKKLNDFNRAVKCVRRWIKKYGDQPEAMVIITQVGAEFNDGKDEIVYKAKQ